MRKLAILYRLLLSLRYRVIISGEDVLTTKAPKLLFPAHQSSIDPQILTTIFLKHINFVPLVSLRYFQVPIVKSILKKLNAIPVSNVQSVNVSESNIANMNNKVLELLQGGNNVLIYPSGQLQGQGYEKIFNKSSAYDIVSQIDDSVRIIGIRVNGLWGSIWSKAWTGSIPDFLKTYLRCIWYVVANFIFFAPRRNVYIEFEDITAIIRPKAQERKQAFNNSLEHFYNKKTDDVYFLKHYFYVPQTKRSLPLNIEGSVENVKSFRKISKNEIPETIVRKVISIINEETECTIENISTESHLILDLGVDSVEQAILVTEVEKRFAVKYSGEIQDIKTVGDLCMIAMGITKPPEPLKETRLWFTNRTKTKLAIDPELNIPDSFIKIFSQHKNEYFAYDKLMGTTTRKEFLQKAIAVSELIKKTVDEKYVGIMLPALQSTTLLIISCYLAKKIPVMINWTVGRVNMMHCIESVNLNHIITATSFYDKVKDQLPDEIYQQCLFFDKEIKNITLTMKLRALLGSIFSTPMYLHKNTDETAVVLFTSGSESNPKAVPLTHKNIVSDLFGVLDKIEVFTHDIFLGFLPPFHSFGYSILSIFPLITGVRTVYSPDPTDSRSIVEILSHTKATTMFATPSFLKMILADAKPNEIKSIRLTVTGAESIPQNVVNEYRKKAPHDAILLEGYGITECSPVLTITDPADKKENTVGHFITGVDHRILDVESDEILDVNQEGMIVVSGNNVFSGYIDKSIKPPFIMIEGKQYYKTGDLGYVDADGCLFITGRLKRFLKFAGEMISLPAIEQCLSEEFINSEEYNLAIEGTDTNNKLEIVLFANTEISVEEANACLRKHGFSNYIRIHDFRYLEEIPVLGTGKTDYKLLKKVAVELHQV